MKSKILLLLFICSIKALAQINYQKAYYIDNNSQKHEVFIKNTDWKNNPTEFRFKSGLNSEPESLSIDDVKEFNIYKHSKYIREKVKIDRSTDILSKLSQTSEPEYKEEELFLKVLLEGKANLYYYEDGKLRRFFYKKENGNIKQLIYKNYLNAENSVGTNSSYKYQLWNEFRCGDISMGEIQKVKYRKDDLSEFFTDYNQCEGSEFTSFAGKEKRDLINLRIRPGLNLSSFKFRESYTGSEDVNFENQISFRLGLELESILPFHNGKWALLVEPGIQVFKNEMEKTSSIGNTSLERHQNISVDYKSLEISLGIRHYFFLNEISTVFVNAAFVIDSEFDSSATFDPGRTIELKSNNNMAFGIGYEYNQRFNAELRYQTTREILTDYFYQITEYNALSLILGYQLF